MDALTDAGLGLDNDTIRFARTTKDWLLAGAELRDVVAENLESVARGVEQVGSSSVLGLLAKPIIDLAVGVCVDRDVQSATSALEATGWIYRGDAGESGGHVFLLEAWPGHRVAHVHVVEHGQRQWVDYLRLRDLLRASLDARQRYEAAKIQLAEECGDDRKAYTDGKTAVVRALLHNVE